MNRYITLLLLFNLKTFGQTVEADRFFPIERSHSYIEFSVKYMGYAKVKGRFADFTGMIYYDDKDLSRMSATMSVKVESIDTDLDFRDNDLRSENWFDAKQFPLITFQSKRSVATQAGFDVIGDLTLRGITKEVTIHMNKPSGVLKDVRADAQIILTGTTSVNRTDFGVEGKNWSGVREGITAVEDKVDLEFSLLAKQIKKDNYRNWVSNPDQAPGKLYSIARDQGAQAAIVEFERMRKENASLKEFPMMNAAYMLQLEGRGADAIMLLEADRVAFPDSPAVYQSLGLAYMRAGNRDRAMENFKTGNLKDPSDPQIIELLRHF